MNSFHGDHHHHPGHPHHPFFPFFFNPYAFFYSPFFYPTYSWYPPFGFSDFGCPYDDYYQQPYYYEPEEGPSEQPSTGEAEQPSEGAEEAPPAAPPEQAQEQTAPFGSEKPLPDVIEWGKASEPGPEKQPVVSGRGQMIVNLPRHTLTILLNQPDPQTAVPSQPAVPQSH